MWQGPLKGAAHLPERIASKTPLREETNGRAIFLSEGRESQIKHPNAPYWDVIFHWPPELSPGIPEEERWGLWNHYFKPLPPGRSRGSSSGHLGVLVQTWGSVLFPFLPSIPLHSYISQSEIIYNLPTLTDYNRSHGSGETVLSNEILMSKIALLSKTPPPPNPCL